MNNWKETTLGRLIDIKHGFAFKGEYFSDIPNGTVLLTPGNFDIKGGFKKSKVKSYTSDIPSDYVLVEDDIIVTMTDLSKDGDTLGYSALIPKDPENRYLHNQRIGLVQLKSNEEVDKKYIYWLMRWREYQRFIVNTASGSTVRHTSPKKIQDFTFSLPPLEEQKKIVGILGSLDDKIELLRKENETLEKLAQTLFKRCFVDFEFPADSALHNQAGRPISSTSPAGGGEGGGVRGYKSSGGKMIDSKLGPIPEGWRVGRFTDIADILGGGTPKTDRKEYWDGNIPFFTPKDANGIYCFGTEKTLTESGLNSCNSKLYPKNTVFITARGTVGKCALAGQDMAMNQSCYALVGKEVSNQYVFLALHHSLRLITGYASGGVFDAITTSTFESMDIVIPDIRSVERFSEAVLPVFEKIFQNRQQMTELSHLRDTLLPRLMSGDIDL